MIPILYDEKENKFITNGIGRLSDAISCIVTEERNGTYELKMEYPTKGKYYSRIEKSAIIWAKPNETSEEQAFRIYKISKPINRIVTVYAEHISYQLSHIPIIPYKASTAGDAIHEIRENTALECPFTFWTDVESTTPFAVDVPKSGRAVLGGTEGSIIDTYGGELEFDNYTVKLHSERGADNGVTIRYGKNLKDVTQEENIQSTITGICPYWEKDGVVTTLPEKVVMCDVSTNYPYARVTVIDMSSEFDETPTEEELRLAAEKYIRTHNIGEPDVSLKVSFEQLWQTEEYKDKATIQRVSLCDYVTIIFEELGVNVKSKVVKTVYDPLNERYTSIELGSSRTNLTTKIMAQKKEIDAKPSISRLQQSIERATALITGNTGGYIVTRSGDDGKPTELFIMDTDDVNTAVRVWRWNLNGLGYSNNGINGPYETAITADGQIVANFITAGTFNGNIIEAGTVYAEALSVDYRNSVKEYADSGDKEVLKQMQTELQVASDGIKMKVSQLENSIEGNIIIYNVSEEPTLENYPAKDWNVPVYPDDVLYPAEENVWIYTKEQYEKHLGSVAYLQGTEYSYKFIIGDDGAPHWKLIENTESSYLLSKVAELQVTADEITAEVAKTEQELKENYYTKTEADSKVTQTAESITAEITSLTEHIENDYYTSEETDTKIAATTEGISLELEAVRKSIDEHEFFVCENIPSLYNYPANEWCVPVYPDDTLYPSGERIWIYTEEEYNKHLGTFIYCEYDEKTYKFVNEDSKYTFREVENTEANYYMEKFAGIDISLDGITQEVRNFENKVAGNYTTKTEMKSAINQTASSITQSISSLEEHIEDEYYTSEETDTKIEATTEYINLQIESVRNTVGENEFYTCEEIPTLNNSPAKDWNVPVYPSYTLYPSSEEIWKYTEDEYDKRVGTMLYSKKEGKTYKFIKSKGEYSFKEIPNSEANYYMERFAGIDISLDGITYEVGSLEEKMVDGYATKEEVKSTINQTSKSILMEVEGTYTTKSETEEQTTEIEGKLELKLDTDKLVSELNMSADEINITGDRFSLESKGTQISKEGKITTNDLQVTGGNIDIDSSANTNVEDGERAGISISATYDDNNYIDMYASSSGGNISLASNNNGMGIRADHIQIVTGTRNKGFLTGYPKFSVSAIDTVADMAADARMYLDGDAQINGVLAVRSTERSNIAGLLVIGSTAGPTASATSYKSWTYGNGYITGNFLCEGTKNRIVDTDNYGKILLNAYETASPMFGDVGTGQLNEECECIIFLDDIFLETIDDTAVYSVFLQKYGQGDLWVDEIQKSYFVVKGTVANLEFAWEVKAKQKGYAAYRLENETTNNYDAEYINSDCESASTYENVIFEDTSMYETVEFEDTSIYETIEFEDTTIYEL